ncbi:MAG: hypothetical protein JRD39_07190 [Deltaproteobacteria bacterium]|jgi:hypothetical protein|nr:hypothetical protein [Deltaproteobacteria bacterium]
MISRLKSGFFNRKLLWSGSPPVSYSAHFSLNRIIPGVDNFHYDVHLSPIFRESASQVIFHLVLKHSGTGEDLGIEFDRSRDKDEFRHLCHDMLFDAVKRAKMGDGEIQIDYLAQVAVCKFLLREVGLQFEELMTRLNNQVWEYESTGDDEMLRQVVILKEKILAVRHERGTTVQNVSREIFSYLLEAQKPLLERRAANYGTQSLLQEDLFTNPLLYIENRRDDYFMLDQYVILGRRMDDPDTYEHFLQLIREVLVRVSITGEKDNPASPQPGRDSDDGPAGSERGNAAVDGWLRGIDNVALLAGYLKTAALIREKKNRQEQDRDELRRLEQLAGEQKKIFAALYNRFKQKNLMGRIVASFEMKEVYREYCPPLAPRQVLEFLLSGEARKSLAAHLKRLKTYYGTSISLTALKKTRMRMGKLKEAQRKDYFLQFLAGFFLYHRDLENFMLFKQALDRVTLVADEETIALSKTNNTLYEFLLPHEYVLELDTKPVTSHVILKADVRGATLITNKLDASGLNPASYFSLNFFNPISEIVSQYGALKVFIEGDAIILAILERRDDKGGKYCVARACGLAINMLYVIQKYNAKSRKYNLPVLELGVGICYQNAPPSYLLDGRKRIMISPAINQADRLSSCSKLLRRVFERDRTPFNLVVCQAGGDRMTPGSDDEAVLRYNVNGIELNGTGFTKLAAEIDLKTLNCFIPEVQAEPIIVHTGKFPLVTGSFQRLIIREDSVWDFNPVEQRIQGRVARKYYEISTLESLKQYVENRESAGSGR